jgi:hypothetical protein
MRCSSAARFWLRAYPRRWRGRPPWWRWALYRGLDVRLPAAWREWAHDDLRGALWPVRYAGQFLVVWVLVSSAMWAVLSRNLGAWSSGLSGHGYALVMAAVAASLAGSSRLRQARVRRPRADGARRRRDAGRAVGPSGWWTRWTWGGPKGVGSEFQVGPVVDRRLAWVLIAVAAGSCSPQP